MTPEEITKIIESEINDDWKTTNHHGVDLRNSLVNPERIVVIHRTVKNGEIDDAEEFAWLVLEENPVTKAGYKIVFDPEHRAFGLATNGFKEDKHLVVVGWHGSFMNTFNAM